MQCVECSAMAGKDKAGKDKNVFFCNNMYKGVLQLCHERYYKRHFCLAVNADTDTA